jgi:hypothetical protein
MSETGANEPTPTAFRKSVRVGEQNLCMRSKGVLAALRNSPEPVRLVFWKRARLRGEAQALEPLHLPLPSSGRLMRILRSIVTPSTAFMAVCDSKITGCSSI